MQADYAETTRVAGSRRGGKAVGDIVREAGSQWQGIGGEEAWGKERDQPSLMEDGGGVSRERYGFCCSLLSIKHIL